MEETWAPTGRLSPLWRYTSFNPDHFKTGMMNFVFIRGMNYSRYHHPDLLPPSPLTRNVARMLPNTTSQRTLLPLLAKLEVLRKFRCPDRLPDVVFFPQR